MSHVIAKISAEDALKKLTDGNRAYVASGNYNGEVSEDIRLKTASEGQFPYAVIITCSDSRVIPEAVFSAGIGDLFVIRVAGNVIDNHQLGSIEYAADHLGSNLVVVLGHTGCGAVGAALQDDPAGYIKTITDEIKMAIGAEKNEYQACVKNVLHAVEKIRSALNIPVEGSEIGLKVIPAIYDIASGKVEFLHDAKAVPFHG